MTVVLPTPLGQVPTHLRKQHLAPEVDVMAKAIDQALTWCDIQRAQGHNCTEAEVMATADRFYRKIVTHETQPVPEAEPHDHEPVDPPDPEPVAPADPVLGP